MIPDDNENASITYSLNNSIYASPNNTSLSVTVHVDIPESFDVGRVDAANMRDAIEDAIVAIVAEYSVDGQEV